MRILMLSSWFAYPPDNGARMRIFNLMKQLSKKHDIVLLSFTQDDFKEEYLKALKPYCKEVYPVKGRWFNSASRKAFLGFFSLNPRSFFETYSRQMQILFDRTVRSGHFDLIFCSGASVVLYPLKIKDVPKIFEEIEVSVIKDRAVNAKFNAPFVKRARNKLTWWKLKRFIKRITSEFDGYTVVSDNEKNNIHQINPSAKGEVIFNGIDVSGCEFSFNKEAKNLIYAGALTYEANFDAIKYFLDDIYPFIKKEVPDIKLRITGSTKNVDINALKTDESVELTGYVKDVRSLVSDSAVCIVPLRIGGGSRLKILEAMAVGAPVVATSKGAEGLYGLRPADSNAHAANIIIADEPRAFAEAVVRLSRDRRLAEQLALSARKLIEEKYDWNKIAVKMENFIKRIAGEK